MLPCTATTNPLSELLPGGEHVVLGMQSAVMLRYLGCRTSPMGCRTCAALLRLQRCVSLPSRARCARQCLPACLSQRVCCGPAGRCLGRVPCAAVREVGQSPLGWQKNCWVGVAPGPAQENAPSWLWDSVDDFNESFFPFLSKLSALMESLVQAEVPRAPCRALLCCPPHPVVKPEPHTPARC